MVNRNSLWWQTRNIEFLNSVLNHINNSKEEHSEIERCADLFHALNNTWSEYYKYRDLKGELTEQEVNNRNDGKPRSDKQAFYQLVLKGIMPEYNTFICKSNQLEALVNLKPQIMNHSKLLESNYDPYNIPEQLVKKSQEDHKQLYKSYQRFIHTNNRSNIDFLLKKVASLLYIVRSNIAHGEKTKRGPDLEKVKRDRIVCEIVYPLVELIFEYIFDKPSTRLVVYGTLTPGQPNEHVLKRIDGNWEGGKVFGKLSEIRNLPAFKWDTKSEKIDIKMFLSDALTNYFSEIDKFEGELYRRILVPVKLENSNITVAYVYEAKLAA